MSFILNAGTLFFCLLEVLASFNLYLQMRLVQVTWRHGVRYILYDVKGKVVIITRDKKVALHYADALESR